MGRVISLAGARAEAVLNSLVICAILPDREDPSLLRISCGHKPRGALHAAALWRCALEAELADGSRRELRIIALRAPGHPLFINARPADGLRIMNPSRIIRALILAAPGGREHRIENHLAVGGGESSGR